MQTIEELQESIEEVRKGIAQLKSDMETITIGKVTIYDCLNLHRENKKLIESDSKRKAV